MVYGQAGLIFNWYTALMADDLVSVVFCWFVLGEALSAVLLFFDYLSLSIRIYFSTNDWLYDSVLAILILQRLKFVVERMFQMRIKLFCAVDFGIFCRQLFRSDEICIFQWNFSGFVAWIIKCQLCFQVLCYLIYSFVDCINCFVLMSIVKSVVTLRKVKNEIYLSSNGIDH